MKIFYSALTDKGSVREINEDSILFCGEIANLQDHFETAVMERELLSDKSFCLAVADGMGGHDSGEVASRMTLEKLKTAVEEHGHKYATDPESLKSAIIDIHKEINMYAESSGKRGMGSTLVGALFSSEAIIVFNVGDSRLYLFRDGYLAQKTRDHSLAEQMGGGVPKNIITSCVGGGKDDITIDIYNLTGKVKENDVLIVCSDGLVDFDVAGEYDAFESVINDHANELTQMNRSLLRFALEQGSADNVSIIGIMIR